MENGARPTVDDLLKEMARLNIGAAVVRHRACFDNGPYFGNQVLLEEIAGHPGLIPAWVFTPDGCEPDFDPRRHYALTVSDSELTASERAGRRAESVDDIDL